MIMEDVLICVVVFYFLYRLFELFIHRKERLLLVQKLESLDSHKSGVDLGKLFAQSGISFGKFSSLRWGLLAIGVAIGLVLAFFIVHGYYSGPDFFDGDILYLGFMVLFGGIGLISSFLIERNLTAKDKRD